MFSRLMKIETERQGKRNQNIRTAPLSNEKKTKLKSWKLIVFNFSGAFFYDYSSYNAENVWKKIRLGLND